MKHTLQLYDRGDKERLQIDYSTTTSAFDQNAKALAELLWRHMSSGTIDTFCELGGLPPGSLARAARTIVELPKPKEYCKCCGQEVKHD